MAFKAVAESHRPEVFICRCRESEIIKDWSTSTNITCAAFAFMLALWHMDSTHATVQCLWRMAGSGSGCAPLSVSWQGLILQCFTPCRHLHFCRKSMKHQTRGLRSHLFLEGSCWSRLGEWPVNIWPPKCRVTSAGALPALLAMRS